MIWKRLAIGRRISPRIVPKMYDKFVNDRLVWVAATGIEPAGT